MDSSKAIKGHKELILVSLLTLGYAILMIALEYRFEGDNWLLSQTIRFALGIGVFVMLLKGNVAAKSLVVTYLVINIIVGVLRTIGSFNVGWISNGILFAGTSLILAGCIYLILKSNNIDCFLKQKRKIHSSN